MKKIFWYATLSVAVVSFCTSPTKAQETPKEKKPWEFGVKITPGQSAYYSHPRFGSSIRSGFNFSFILGFHAGKRFSSRWGWQVGCQIAYRTGKTNYTNSIAPYYYRNYIWLPEQRMTEYLGLEFTPRINSKLINHNKFNLYLFGGGLIGVVFKQRDAVQEIHNNRSENRTVFENQYSGNLVWGLTLGLGAHIPINQRLTIAIEPQTQPVIFFSVPGEFTNVELSFGLIWKK